MANTVTRTVEVGLEARPRDYVIVYTVQGDGSGEVLLGTANSIINATTGDTKVIGYPSYTGKNSLLELTATATGCSAQLYFDATTPLYAWQIASDHTTHICFEENGGLKNVAFGTAGYTGNYTIQTNGLGALDSLTLKLKIRVK